MILFESQWEDYPDAIVDTKTKNSSFVYYSGLLKTMGVSNHKWPLQLHDAGLQGIDPRDPSLSPEIIERIVYECKNNFFYFLREVMIIPGSDDLETVQFRFNRGVAALYWLYFAHVVPYLVMIRQTGKSFGMDTLDVWLLNVRLFYAELALVTKNETLRSSNMRRIKEIEETLPWYLRTRHPKDPANSEEYRVSPLKNVLKAHLASASPKVAEGLGRGLTNPHTRFDELAYLFNIEISLPAALAAGTAARDRARRRGDPYGTILATTAGKKDDRDGRYAYNLMMDSAPWSEALMDSKDEETLHQVIRSMSRSDDIMVIASFIHRQLGYSDEWLRNAVREAKAKGEDAERDFGNRWTSGSLTSPLGPEITEVIRNSEIREPRIEIDDRYNYAIRWVNHPDFSIGSIEERHCVIGLDSSDAIGRDDIGLVITDVATGGVLGAADFNRVSLFDFSKWLGDFLVRYPKAVLVPEMRSSARSIVDYLIHRLLESGQDPWKRIYNSVVQNSNEKPSDFQLVRQQGRRSEVIYKFKEKFGFATSGSGETARNALYGRNLSSAAQHCGRMVHDSRLINQILSLVVRNGRLDHQLGGHDDLCVAWLLSHWFLTNGKNMDYYGIPSSLILRYVDTGKEFANSEERYKVFLNNRLRQELDRIAEAMKNETDEYIYQRLENRARMLIRTMRADELQTFSVSDFFEQIRLRRSQNHTLA